VTNLTLCIDSHELPCVLVSGHANWYANRICAEEIPVFSHSIALVKQKYQPNNVHAVSTWRHSGQS
jgi:hypothetical protein